MYWCACMHWYCDTMGSVPNIESVCANANMHNMQTWRSRVQMHMHAPVPAPLQAQAAGQAHSSTWAGVLQRRAASVFGVFGERHWNPSAACSSQRAAPPALHPTPYATPPVLRPHCVTASAGTSRSPARSTKRS